METNIIEQQEAPIKSTVRAAWSKTIGRFVYVDPQGNVCRAGLDGKPIEDVTKTWRGTQEQWNNTFFEVVNACDNASRKQALREGIPYRLIIETSVIHASPESFEYTKGICKFRNSIKDKILDIADPYAPEDYEAIEDLLSLLDLKYSNLTVILDESVPSNKIHLKDAVGNMNGEIEIVD